MIARSWIHIALLTNFSSFHACLICIPVSNAIQHASTEALLQECHVMSCSRLSFWPPQSANLSGTNSRWTECGNRLPSPRCTTRNTRPKSAMSSKLTDGAASSWLTQADASDLQKTQLISTASEDFLSFNVTHSCGPSKSKTPKDGLETRSLATGTPAATC